MIKVGIVGAGGMGASHARNLMADQRVQITSIADMIPAKADALASETGARACGSVEDLLDSGVDAIYVTTPNTQHAPAVLAALRRNVHVFSEKPMATSLAEAAQIRAAARQSTATYQVGHNRRFAPAYRFLKDRIAEGFQPYLANAKQNDGDWLNPPWITNLALTGGFLYESSVHMLDMLRWLMGEVVAVNARAQTRVYDLPCDFAILLSFEGNRHAVFSSSAHASWAFPFESLEIVGEHACLRTEEMTRAFYSPGLAQEMLTQDYTQLPRALQWGYRQADDAFITAIAEQQDSSLLHRRADDLRPSAGEQQDSSLLHRRADDLRPSAGEGRTPAGGSSHDFRTADALRPASGRARESALAGCGTAGSRVPAGGSSHDFSTAVGTAGSRVPAVTVEDAYKSIELCEACYRSASRDGATVGLPLDG
jgi:myo-inositol 2-dehydrogenase/D-chiro-inositol 1-dehydrogenase